MDRPTSQSNQRACDTRNGARWKRKNMVRQLAVSGQTRIQWESSARGALRSKLRRKNRIPRIGSEPREVHPLVLLGVKSLEHCT